MICPLREVCEYTTQAFNSSELERAVTVPTTRPWDLYLLHLTKHIIYQCFLAIFHHIHIQPSFVITSISATFCHHLHHVACSSFYDTTSTNYSSCTCLNRLNRLNLRHRYNNLLSNAMGRLKPGKTETPEHRAARKARKREKRHADRKPYTYLSSVSSGSPLYSRP